jgi:hypothetical protein
MVCISFFVENARKQCSFLPKFHISVETRYEDNSGTTENSHSLSGSEFAERIVDTIDIVKDTVLDHKYKETEGSKNLFFSIASKKS